MGDNVLLSIVEVQINLHRQGFYSNRFKLQMAIGRPSAAL